MPRTVPLTAGWLALAAGGLLLAALPARPAAATKEYARKEQKDCSHCHVNEKGAGPRNARGREYEANGHRFGVTSWSSAANERAFLRANSALISTWYSEAAQLLEGLVECETLPGGRALAEATLERVRPFPGAWLRGARKLLEKGDRGLPNALGLLVRLESQFPGTDEGREAVLRLDELAADPARKEQVEAARATERARLGYLEGRTEFNLGNLGRAKELLEKVLEDQRLSEVHEPVREMLAVISKL